jgi:hypothetical protein
MAGRSRLDLLRAACQRAAAYPPRQDAVDSIMRARRETRQCGRAQSARRCRASSYRLWWGPLLARRQRTRGRSADSTSGRFVYSPCRRLRRNFRTSAWTAMSPAHREQFSAYVQEREIVCAGQSVGQGVRRTRLTDDAAGQLASEPGGSAPVEVDLTHRALVAQCIRTKSFSSSVRASCMRRAASGVAGGIRTTKSASRPGRKHADCDLRGRAPSAPPSVGEGRRREWQTDADRFMRHHLVGLSQVSQHAEARPAADIGSDTDPEAGVAAAPRSKSPLPRKRLEVGARRPLPHPSGPSAAGLRIEMIYSGVDRPLSQQAWLS